MGLVFATSYCHLSEIFCPCSPHLLFVFFGFAPFFCLHFLTVITIFPILQPTELCLSLSLSLFCSLLSHWQILFRNAISFVNEKAGLTVISINKLFNKSITPFFNSCLPLFFFFFANGHLWALALLARPANDSLLNDGAMTGIWRARRSLSEGVLPTFKEPVKMYSVSVVDQGQGKRYFWDWKIFTTMNPKKNETKIFQNGTA